MKHKWRYNGSSLWRLHNGGVSCVVANRSYHKGTDLYPLPTLSGGVGRPLRWDFPSLNHSSPARIRPPNSISCRVRVLGEEDNALWSLGAAEEEVQVASSISSASPPPSFIAAPFTKKTKTKTGKIHLALTYLESPVSLLSRLKQTGSHLISNMQVGNVMKYVEAFFFFFYFKETNMIAQTHVGGAGFRLMD